jgi:hypothetical protein
VLRRRRTALVLATTALVAVSLAPTAAQAMVSDGGTTTVPIGLPTTPPAPTRYTGPAFVIGDSVLLGARTCVAAKGWSYDAKGSRQAPAVRDVLASMGKRLPHLVAVHVGTNAGVTDQQIDAIMKVLGPKRIVVWITIQLPNDGRYSHELRSNTTIRHAAWRFPNTRLADWNAKSEPNLAAWTWSDHIHLQPAGCRAFATLIDSVGRAPVAA